MTRFAMLFPGQGSQHIGMLSSFLKNRNFNAFKDTFNEASHYLHYNLLKLIQEGSKQTLNQNKYMQPAILTASVATYRYWNKKNGQSPTFMAGHSLGEYSALVCSHSIKFSDALKIVALRGELMQKITIKKEFLMQAIIGLNQQIIKNICLSVSKNKKVSLASINSHKQIVISGDKSAVYQAGLNCKKYGAQRVLNLNINVPAHCEIMKPIAIKIKKILNKIQIKSPQIPVVNNFNVKSEKSSKNIKNALVKQIYHTVRWIEIIEFIKLKKTFTMLEIGPKKILTNLNKKHKNLVSFSTNNLKNFLIAFKKINKQQNED